MSSYVAHSSKPNAVQCVRELRARIRLAVALASVGILLVLITSWLPETSALQTWVVILGALALIGAFSVYMTLGKPHEDVGRLLREGSVRKVSRGVRRNYRAFIKGVNVNPCDDELFDYDKESQISREALDAKFRARHGRNRDV